MYKHTLFLNYYLKNNQHNGNGSQRNKISQLIRRPTSVVVITFALHAKGPEFEPQVDQFLFLPTTIIHSFFNNNYKSGYLFFITNNVKSNEGIFFKPC